MGREVGESKWGGREAEGRVSGEGGGRVGSAGGRVSEGEDGGRRVSEGGGMEAGG